MEADYKAQLSRLQRRLEDVITQHQQVITVKDDQVKELQATVDRLKADYADKERAWQLRFDDQQAQMSKLKERLARSQEFFDDKQRAQLIRRYEDRMANMRLKHEEEVKRLLWQCSQEKSAAMEVLKAKIKTEINLLVPRLKDQLHKTQAAQASKLKEQAERDMQTRYEQIIAGIREEARLDKSSALTTQRKRYETEKQDYVKRMRSHFERRLLEVKNEAERRVLARLRPKLAR